ncbi:MAG: zinc ribbon domain-containing protein [Campylobacter sp.]|nr:zinc ribbon domain-containing protein [Campylobacter sp.]
MNKYLTQLIELSEYDKQIDDFIPKIENIQKTLASKQDEIDELQAQIDSFDDSVKDLKLQISRTNSQIEDFAKKIKEIAKKKGSIKTEKELTALSIEEEVAKEQLGSANEEIARLEKLIANREDAKKELEDKKSALDAEFKKLESTTGNDLKDIEDQRNKLWNSKNELTKQMDKKILSFYEKIRKWAKNTAVVPVKKQACYGCFLRINDKTYNLVLRGEEITTCPHCGRILYKPEVAED